MHSRRDDPLGAEVNVTRGNVVKPEGTAGIYCIRGPLSDFRALSVTATFGGVANAYDGQIEGVGLRGCRSGRP